jgi:hypothetical protein
MLAMNEQRQFAFEVSVDYQQFYLQDAEVYPDAPTDWNDEDVERRAKVAPNVVVVCPLRNDTVRAELVIDSHPATSSRDADHVVMCALEVPSGVLQVHECTGGECLRVNIEPGTYAVLLEFFRLATISEDGFEGDDLYRMTLWPSEPRSLQVIKAWPQVA